MASSGATLGRRSRSPLFLRLTAQPTSGDIMPTDPEDNKSLISAITLAKAMKADGKKLLGICRLLNNDDYEKFTRRGQPQNWSPGMLQQLGI